MSNEAHLIVSQHGKTSVISFDDAVILDAFHIDLISQRFFALVEREGHHRLAIDLSTIKMISSQTLGVFIKLKKIAEERGGDVVFCGIDPRLYKVFKITSLDRLFRFFEDRQQAMEFFLTCDSQEEINE